MYVLFLFQILAILQAVLSTVSVPPTVVIKLPYENALVPCNYTPPSDHPPNEAIPIHWERQDVQGQIVVKNSVGKVTARTGFNLSGACSLVLESPTVNQSGVYTVTLYYTGSEYDSDHVQVHVFNETTILYSNGDGSEKSGSTCERWIAGFFTVVIVSGIAVCVLLCFYIRHVRRQRVQTNDSQNKNLMSPQQEGGNGKRKFSNANVRLRKKHRGGQRRICST